MKKIASKKLVLARETLQALSGEQLGQVAGASGKMWCEQLPPPPVVVVSDPASKIIGGLSCPGQTILGGTITIWNKP
jgi:hypothetical protein